jgi:hypothetical protein
MFTAAFAAGQTGSVSVNIVSLGPPTATAIADTLVVGVSVVSTYEVSSVRATLGALSTNLVFSGGLWTNVIDTSSLIRGLYTVDVLAQDIFGNTGQTQGVVRVDRPPVLNLVSPLDGTVGRSNLYVSVTASDDDPAGVRIDVYNGPTRLFSATNAVNRFISPFSGVLRVTATDSRNQTVFVQRTVYAEPSTNLTEAITAPGPLLDFAGPRLLYVLPDPPTVQLLDLSSGLTISGPSFWSTYPPPGEYYQPVQGWVSAASAVVVYDTPYVPEYTLALQGSNFVVAAVGRSPEKVVNGVAVIFPELYDFSKSTNGCSVYLGDCPASFECGSYGAIDLTESEMVIASTNGLFRSRPTDPTNVCSRTVSLLSSISLLPGASNPVSDGTNVVFRWGTNLIANINGQDEVLPTWLFTTPQEYAATAGWIAFARLGNTGQRHVWARSPSGQVEQRTFFGVSSYLESLNSGGALTFQIYDQSGPPPADI